VEQKLVGERYKGTFRDDGGWATHVFVGTHSVLQLRFMCFLYVNFISRENELQTNMELQLDTQVFGGEKCLQFILKIK
jgi:hypothetical protein